MSELNILKVRITNLRSIIYCEYYITDLQVKVIKPAGQGVCGIRVCTELLISPRQHQVKEKLYKANCAFKFKNKSVNSRQQQQKHFGMVTMPFYLSLATLMSVT